MKRGLMLLVSILAAVMLAYSAAADERSGSDSGFEDQKDNPALTVADVNEKLTDGINVIKDEVKARVENKDGILSAKKEIKARRELKPSVQAKDILKREAFGKLSTEGRAKLEKLNAERLEKLSELRNEQLEKLNELKYERLRVLTKENTAYIEKISELSKDVLEKFSKLDRSRIKELSNLSTGEIEAKLKKVSIIKADEGFKFRPLSLEKIRTVANSYEQLKENEEKLRERYEERKAKLDEVKLRAEKCREAGEDCGEVTKEAVNQSREAALAAADRMITYLQKLRDRIEGSEDISPSDAEARLAAINALIEKVEGIKTAIGAAQTKEEMNSAVRELKEAIKEVKKKSESNVNGLLKAQITGIIKRSEIEEKKLDCSLAAMENENIDTNSIDAMVEEFSALIAQARSRIDESKALLESGNETQISQGKALVSEARDSVKEAQQKLVEIKKQVTSLGGSICTGEQEIAVEEEPESKGNSTEE